MKIFRKKAKHDRWANTAVNGIHRSRYIASWINAGGNKNFIGFRDWLESLGIDEDEAYEIYNMATCGKMELETSAKKFIKG